MNIMDDNVKRYDAKIALENAGSMVCNYVSNGMNLYIKRGYLGNVALKANEIGGKMEDQIYYFPLGSDNPSDDFRHDGGYNGSKGFWLIARVIFD
jgi:hypothetical protein